MDDINVAAVREKSIRHGHPSTLHLWWARRPLAAARAVLFAQLVNDPGYERYLGRGMNKEKAVVERERLFGIIRELVKWENTNNEEVLKQAREEIWKSWRETCALNKDHPQAKELFNPEKLPAFHDPFAGGGAIPLEAQRLGLDAYASDLNPVAVTINKAMIEIPPKFAGKRPVNPEAKKNTDYTKGWRGADGLAEDVRYYGQWMREEAFKRIGHLYPQVEITKETVKDRLDLKELDRDKLTVIAWIWARTVKSPNPAYSHVDVPLASTFVLSKKSGKEAWIEPIVKGDQYHFKVRIGKPPKEVESGTKPAGRGSTFECLVSKSPIDGKYIKAEGQAGRMGSKLMAIVAEGKRGRIYISPTEEHEKIAQKAQPTWKPEQELTGKSADQLPLYGMKQYWQIFTPRQLVALTTFSDLVQDASAKCKQDAIVSGMNADGKGLDAGGIGADAYAEAMGVYLAFQIDQLANHLSTVCAWHINNEQLKNTFARQCLQMTWDYAETNSFSSSTGSLINLQDRQIKAFQSLPSKFVGHASQKDAQSQVISKQKLVSTDPPYYDNICYADLSDYFYIWLRRSLKTIFPQLFATMVVPKTEELIASPYRHHGKKEAEGFFLDGMTKAMRNIAEQSHPAFPVSIYYAFKQSETQCEEGTHSTGWETFLEAIFRSCFVLTGTWPMSTEQTAAMKTGTNALASSIVLVCRKRPADAPAISRREFVRELNTILPEALVDMTCGGDHSPVAPVDLSQAIIGPGMAVFSKYSAVLEADGKPMTVRTALQLINRFLAEDDFDHDTQFCLHWFETVGWSEGKFGEADVLARAKGTSVEGLKEAGVIASGSGKVRLLKWSDYPSDWNPESDLRLPVWEALHHLIRALRTGGETAAAVILGKLGPRIEAVRQLAYRLYTLCERKGWAEDARAYNELISTWQAIEAVAPKTTEKQMDLF